MASATRSAAEADVGLYRPAAALARGHRARGNRADVRHLLRAAAGEPGRAIRGQGGDPGTGRAGAAEPGAGSPGVDPVPAVPEAAGAGRRVRLAGPRLLLREPLINTL